MSRIFAVCLCAITAFVATTGVSLIHPLSALAASGTLTVETPLHQDPNHGAPMIALLTEGTVVSIDGPPVDGFYPVTAGTVTGWMRGETMTLAKDIVDEAAGPEATPGTSGEAPLPAQDPGDPSLQLQDSAPADVNNPPPPTETPAVDPAANGQTTGDPAATAVPANGTMSEPGSGLVDPAATGTTVADPAMTAPPVASAPAATPAPLADPAATEIPPADPAATSGDLADPALAAPEADPAPVNEPVPTPDPNAPLIPVAVTGPEGPASAAADVPIRVGPGPDYDLISTAPLGSTIQQTGHVIDGYVSVQFADITGWAALDHLAAPGTVTAPPSRDDTRADTPSATTPEADDSKRDKRERDDEPVVEATPTPEPPSIGPASVTVDMPIFAGPGPNSGLIFTVPQGSTVEKTGELVDGYVSVQYKEVFGWAAREHLAEPIAFVEETLPEETVEPVDTKTPRPGSGVAFTTVDLSLRAGPSAEEEPIVVVPAGSRVELTGVMEGNFQRVTYGEDIGWIANDYLANPKDPKPNGERKNDRKNYSEREIVRIIYQAADRYDQSRKDMLRVATCESNLDPYAVNPSGSYGLFQFIRSTWESTPYGDEDIFDPQANANAAAWMWSEGRKSEWVCQ